MRGEVAEDVPDQLGADHGEAELVPTLEGGKSICALELRAGIVWGVCAHPCGPAS